VQNDPLVNDVYDTTDGCDIVLALVLTAITNCCILNFTAVGEEGSLIVSGAKHAKHTHEPVFSLL
jgi:hypothetical protein